MEPLRTILGGPLRLDPEIHHAMWELEIMQETDEIEEDIPVPRPLQDVRVPVAWSWWWRNLAKPQNLPLTKARNLPTYSITADNLKDKSGNAIHCSICINDVEAGDMVKSWQYCHHIFHAECLQQWIQLQLTCPLCRRGLDWTTNGYKVPSVGGL